MIRSIVRMLVSYVGFALLRLDGSTGIAQQVDASKTRETDEQKANSEWLHDVYFKEMAAYNFYLDPAHHKKLSMRREPVLRYPAPPEQCWGEIYVWTDRGRAAALGCVFGGPEETDTHRIFHEFHSLSAQPLFSQGGGTAWQPEESGLTFEAVPDAPAPEHDKARRLAQMWAIARHFKAGMDWKNMIVQLRFLPKPLYRYELSEKDSPVVDGAIFAYAHDEIDDPEVLLVVEAQKTGSDVKWQYALVRLTDRETWVTRDEKEVWRVARGGGGIFDGNTKKRYFVTLLKTIKHESKSK
jgi:hypothetical protein